METQDASQSGRSFIAAADQYQLAIDAGIDNPVVRRFLADAQFKSGDLAAAVVHYRTSWQMDPNDEVTLERWRAATQALSPLLVNGRPQSEADPLLETERGWDDWLYSASGVGSATMLAAAAWLLTVVRTITQKRFAKYAVIAMGLTLVCCVLVRMSGPTPIASVVFSKEDVTMRSGDGNGFEPIAELSSAYGHEAVLLDQRSGWVQVRLPPNWVGWVDESRVLLNL